MSKKLLKNTTVLLIIFFMLFQIVLPSFSNASYSVDSAYIYDKGDCGRHLQYWNSSKNAWYYIVTDFVVYSKDGVEYPAFCLNKDRHGVGTVPAYTVSVTGAVNDQQIWRVITNSYPYKTPQDMGVWNEQDAFVATKQAVYCILYGTDPYSYFKGVDSEGEAIKQAIINLVNIGKNGSQTYQEARVNINKTGDLYKDNIGGINYYSQNYNVSSPVELASFDVAIANFPAGTKVFNMNNGEQYSFNGTQTIKISIPELSITTDVNGIVLVQNARCKTTPILFGATPNDEWQNYALTGDPYEIANSNATEQFKGNVSSITINKTDVDTNEGIDDTEFQLIKDGNVIDTKTTNDEGVAQFTDLYAGSYTVRESRTNDNYIPNNQEQNQDLIYNQQATMTLTNEHKKGTLKVNKIDKDNNKIQMGHVLFDVYSKEFDKVVNSVRTDENGEITLPNMRTGTYTLKEKETNKWYTLAPDTDVEVYWEQEQPVSEYTIQDEKKKGTIEINKYDQDYPDIKLKGVKFNIYDEEGNKIQTLTTDKNGQATSMRLPIDTTYTVKETKTLDNYYPDDTTYQVQFTEDGEVKELDIPNEHKKGTLEVTKLDKDDNNIVLPNAKFDIYSYEFDKVIGTYTTDENGKFNVEDLRTGKYQLREIEAPEFYNPSDTIDFEIQDKQTTVLTVEDEEQKGTISINKFDQDFQPIRPMSIEDDNQEEPIIIELKGVEFNIYDKNGNVVDTLVTDEYGQATSKELPLLYSPYTVKEVKTLDDYNLNDEPYTVNLYYDKQEEYLTFTNEHKKGTLEVTKLDKDDNNIVLPNAKFDIYSYEFDKVIGTYTTDENGKFNVEDLRTGKYQLREIEAPEFYNPSDTIDFEIQDKQTTVLTVEDEKQKGTIIINKTDLDDKNIKLAGVKFEIYDKDGNVVDTLVTDGNGQATSKRLPIDNSYTVKEIETIENYNIDDKTYNIEFTENNEIQTLNLTNEHQKGNLEVYKHDSEEEKALQGAEFEIRSLTENKVIGTYTTDENGKINITGLRTGTYLLKETKAPEGYKLSKDIAFAINKDQTTTLDIAELKIEQPVEQSTSEQPTTATLEVLPKTGF